ncbi:MAG: pseudoazurin [Pseudomonadota bacterium]
MPFDPSRRLALKTGAAAIATLATSKSLLAETSHEVQMLNAHPEDRRARQVFFPRIMVVEAGDTVNFVSTDKGHNSVAKEGMYPEGVEGWESKINDDIAVTFDKPGFYGYECVPHATLGMVGLVIVKGEGMMDNLEAAQSVRQRGKARSVWEEIWEEVAAMEADLTA